MIESYLVIVSLSYDTKLLSLIDTERFYNAIKGQGLKTVETVGSHFTEISYFQLLSLGWSSSFLRPSYDIKSPKMSKPVSLSSINLSPFHLLDKLYQ